MGTRVVFRGRLLTILTKRVRLPNGYDVTLEIVRHAGAALIIPFLTKDKVLFLRQFRPVINSYLYELPAGTRDAGESPRECARREVLEETGYAARTLTKLGQIFPVPGYSTEKITIFKAQRLRRAAMNAEKDEVIRCSAKTRAEVRRLFRRGEIVDAKTIAALAMCGII